MAMSIEVTCAMCGRDRPERAGKGCYGFMVKNLNRENIILKLEADGWIVQQNGDNTDIYCSKKCAA